MRKVIANEFMSLDGVIQSSGSDDDTTAVSATAAGTSLTSTRSHCGGSPRVTRRRRSAGSAGGLDRFAQVVEHERRPMNTTTVTTPNELEIMSRQEKVLRNG
jgi:hypothetical protein